MVTGSPSFGNAGEKSIDADVISRSGRDRTFAVLNATLSSSSNSAIALARSATTQISALPLDAGVQLVELCAWLPAAIDPMVSVAIAVPPLAGHPRNHVTDTPVAAVAPVLRTGTDR